MATPDRPWRVFVIDEHRILREGLKALLEPEYCVCGGASSTRMAFEALGAAKAKPDVIISEISHSENGIGIELLRDLRSRFPPIPVLVLSGCADEVYAERALRAGAIGYVMKGASAEELQAALALAVTNKVYLNERMAAALLSQHTTGIKRTDGPIEALSEREFEIFQLVGHGLSSKEIASELGISVKTVESHRSHIAAKLPLGANDRLLSFAARWVGANVRTS